MSGRHTGYRNRRPRREPPCIPITSSELAFRADAAAVAAAPEPRDCPRCDGRGTGCGTCGGLGFLPEEEWKVAVQLAFIHACGLVLPCEADGSGEAA